MQGRIINSPKKKKIERECVITFLCKKNMHWTKNLYGLTSFRWNLNTFDGPLAHATFNHVDDVQISLVHVFLSAIASLTQKIDDWKE